MRNSTPEGRRLFGMCVGIGVVIGIIGGALTATTYRRYAEFQPCKPDVPSDFDECRVLDVAGFHLHSTLNAGLTIGVMVAIVGWVLAVVATLYSTGQQHHHQEH
jgi:hypothetical protein